MNNRIKHILSVLSPSLVALSSFARGTVKTLRALFFFMTFMNNLFACFRLRHGLTLLAAITCASVASAGVVQFNLSGRGGVGLLATNEPGAIVGGTGGEIGAGITFDDVTRVLTLNVGWGSANGFTNLSSTVNNSHIHGPTTSSGVAAFSQTAGVLIDLPRLSNSASAGSIVTNVTLSAGQAVELLAGRYYVNVHTANNGGGEARGFLVPVLITVTTNSDGGPGSLRQAVRDVGTNGSPYTIAFATNLSGATITLTNEIVLGTSVTIDAANLAAGLTVDGGPGANRIFTVSSGTTNVLRNLTLTGGNGLGALENGNGGAIYNEGSLTLTACTVSSNSAGAGGGIFSQFSSSQLIMNNCTVAGNTANFGGGFLIRNSGTVSLVHCTISGNIGTGGSGGVVLESSATLALQNTIVAGNVDDIGGCGGTLTRSGNNIIGVQPFCYPAVAPVGAPNVNGDYVGTSGSPVNALLAALGNYGGPTRTMRPLPGSPAIDRCTNGTSLTIDQRGFPRIAGPFADIGAVEFQDASPVVVNAGDSGPGSLRYAITYCPVGSTITFTNTLSGSTITLSNGQITLNKNLTIDASALAGGISINGNAASRVFNVAGGTTNVLTGLTITNGNTSGDGGGILNLGTLTINQCTLSHNFADGSGGGIKNNVTLTVNSSTLSGNFARFTEGGAIRSLGLLTLNRSTISSNTAISGDGGGLSIQSTTIVNSSTFSGNSSAYSGGGIRNRGNLTINSSTLSGNVALGNSPFYGGGGIFSDGAFAVSNSIVAGNTAFYSTNISGSFSGVANLTNGDPLLAPLGNYGGPTRTMPPLPGSPAIDGCTSGTSFVTDQRGFPRIAGPFADIGAVEFQDASPVVLNNNDSGPGSLRYAVAYSPVGSTITFTNTLSGQTIVLTSGELSLRKNQTIDASSLASGITVDGGNAFRTFYAHLGTTNVLTGLTLMNGLADRGGAVFNLGNLTLNRCTVAGSSATGVGVGGGGIYNEGVLTVNASTLSGNSASGYGGGIENYAGTLILNQSTLSGNACSGDGGGGLDIQDGAVFVNQSTVTGNSSSSSNGVGGIVKFSGSATLTIYNSIVAGNSAPVYANLAGAFTALGNNLTNGNPLLAPLGQSGGPTPTRLPLPGSPAIDGCTSGTIFTNDQRGFSRPIGPFADIGAVEAGNWIPGYSAVVTTNDDSFNGLDIGGVSLREAIAFSAPNSTVTFATNLSGATILLTSGELVLDKNLAIDGSALANGISISGNNASRILVVNTNRTVSLASLTLVHGNGVGSILVSRAGAICNFGSLSLDRCTLAYNSAGVDAGAIYNGGAGILSMTQCTLANNHTTFDGGAIYNLGTSVTLNQCTLSGNSAGGNGGAILNRSILTLTNTIVGGNSAAASLSSDIRNNAAITCYGANIIQAIAGAAVTGSVPITNAPLLAPLGNYGGPTPTMPPLAGSPAIDGCTSGTTFTHDQRGFPRPAGPFADIGAVEFQDSSTIVVNNANSGPGSLRYVATYCPVGSTITFASGLSGATIVLTNGEILLNRNIQIDASALPVGITVSGNNSSRIFYISPSAVLSIAGLTFTQGNGQGATASGYGGAILNDGILTALNCTFVSNSASEGGGGISGGVTLVNCTLTGNYGGRGGAIDQGAPASLTHCTVTGNSAGIDGGGVLNYFSLLTVTNSIIAGNTPDDISNSGGTVTLGGTNVINAAPRLAPLGNYGGPTQTMPPLPGSPAIDAAALTIFTTDQRGYPRPAGAGPDIGAVEGVVAPPRFLAEGGP